MGRDSSNLVNRKIGLFFLFASVIVLIIIGLNVFNENPEQHQDESSGDWFGNLEFFIVPAGGNVIREREFLKGTGLTISFEVIEGGGITCLALNETNYLKWQNGQPFNCPFPFLEGVGSGEIQFLIVNDGKWFIVWDNSFDSTNDKKVSALVYQ